MHWTYTNALDNTTNFSSSINTKVGIHCLTKLISWKWQPINIFIKYNEYVLHYPTIQRYRLDYKTPKKNIIKSLKAIASSLKIYILFLLCNSFHQKSIFYIVLLIEEKIVSSEIVFFFLNKNQGNTSPQNAFISSSQNVLPTKNLSKKLNIKPISRVNEHWLWSSLCTNDRSSSFQIILFYFFSIFIGSGLVHINI